MRLYSCRSFSKLTGSSKKWMERHTSDAFVKKATAQNMRSRSAFKLTEIQDQKKIIKRGSFVVDLGAAPGGWSVAASQYLDPTVGGLLCAVDLLPMKDVPHCTFIQGDFTDKAVRDSVLAVGSGRLPDVVLSDMLHNRTGHRHIDYARSIDLFYTVLEFCEDNLRPMGAMVVKILRGGDDKEVLEDAKKTFHEVQFVKPAASRNVSSEIYLVAMNRR